MCPIWIKSSNWLSMQPLLKNHTSIDDAAAISWYPPTASDQISHHTWKFPQELMAISNFLTLFRFSVRDWFQLISHEWSPALLINFGEDVSQLYQWSLIDEKRMLWVSVTNIYVYFEHSSSNKKFIQNNYFINEFWPTRVIAFSWINRRVMLVIFTSVTIHRKYAAIARGHSEPFLRFYFSAPHIHGKKLLTNY